MKDRITPKAGPLVFMLGGGVTGALMRGIDWSTTPLGLPESWPSALKTAVSLMLGARQPVYVAWGPELISLYNDGYLPIVGTKHPQGFAKPFKDLWSEIWTEFQPIVEATMAGDAQHFVDLPIALAGRPDRPVGYFTFSYTALRDEDGAIAGFYCAATETTDEVLAEQRLAEERERQRRMLQQMPGFVALLSGPEHRFDYVNDAYREIAGNRDFIGRAVREVFPDIAGQGFYELLDQVYQTGERFIARTLPLSLERADGRRFIDLTYEPIRDDDGVVTGIFAGGYDITDRVRAEHRREILLDLDRRLANTADTAELSFAASELLGVALGAVRVGYGAVDPDAQTITVERNWSAEGYLSVAGRHDFKNYGTYIEDLRRGNVVANADVTLDPRTAGNTTSFDALGIAAFLDVPLIEEGRMTSEMFVHSDVPRDWTLDDIALVNDVAERTRAAIARRSAERHLRDLNADLERRVIERSAEPGTTWQVSPHLLSVIDMHDGKFLRVSPAWFLHLGWSEDDLVGMPYVDFVHPDDIAGSLATFERVKAGAPVLDFENRYRRKGGEYEWLSWVAVPEAGKLYSTSRLITQEKAQAEALEVAQDALRQSQKMEAVGQLTGGIAHDFNNLLAAMGGSFSLIERRLADGKPGVERYISSGQDAVRRAASLTQRLLAFSRRQTLDPVPTDVNKLIAGMDELIRRSVGPAVQMEVVGAVGLWATRVDQPQLESALLNLCINARDAMAPNGGRIIIETANKWLDDRVARERDLRPGQYISLCVSDTGAGMDADTQSRVFDPFFTTKPLGQGTGLGLSMVYGFVRQSGGQVRIYSEVGKGTTMCLYLPRYAGDVEEEPVREVDALQQATVGETILVIDDEPTLRMLMRDVLEEAGYRVLQAAAGPEGLRVLQSDVRVDLLVTDVGLPGGVNGRQVADAARIRRPDLNVLFITGYADNAAVGNGHLEPGMEVLTKPFEIESLANKVREMLDR